MAGQGAKGGGQVAMPAAQAMGGSRGPMGPQGALGGPIKYSNMGPDTMPQGSFTPSAGILGGPSIVMPNGMSSGDVRSMGGNVSVATGPIDTGLGALGPQQPMMLPPSGPTMRPNPNLPNQGLPMPSGGLKGGIFGQQPRPMPQPSQAQYAPLAPQGQFNVNQAAAGALQQAMGATQQGLGFTPMGIRPTAYRPSQIAGTSLAPYTNPYESQVVQQTMRDIGSAQEQALNLQGAQAQRANAFGGSRQGIAEAETRLGYGQQAADAATRMRQQGFQQAQQAAMFDVGQRASTEAANVAAQQAAQRFGAESQYGAQASNIARQQQVEAANVAARTGAAQYGAGARTAAQLGNINRAQQVQAANAAAQMQAAQYAAQQRASAQAQNLAAQQAAMGTRLGAAQQLAGLGQQAFGTGQAIQQQQMQQGLLQQMLQQSLIDAAKAQYAGYTGAPSAALAAPLAALGATPDQSTTTKSMQPGLFNYLQLGASMFPR